MLVLLLLVATAHAKPGECVVAGHEVTLEDVAVQPSGEEPFNLNINTVPAVAHIPARCGAPLSLDVGGAIVFSASRDLVRLTLTRDVTTPDGLVTFKRGSEVINACMRGDRVFASAVLANEDTLEGEHKPADKQVTNVEVPCDALSLDPMALGDDDYFMATKTSHDWEPRDKETSSIALYMQPNVNADVRMFETPSCSGCIDKLGEVKHTKHWVLVEIAGMGVTARGWVRRSLLQRLPDNDTDIYGGIGCYGDHGGGFWGFSSSPNSVEREGTVRIGTTVYVGDGTSPWGTFARDEHVKVRITPGSLWVDLIEVPGLYRVLGRVRLDAVKLDPTP